MAQLNTERLSKIKIVICTTKLACNKLSKILICIPTLDEAEADAARVICGTIKTAGMKNILGFNISKIVKLNCEFGKVKWSNVPLVLLLFFIAGCVQTPLARDPASERISFETCTDKNKLYLESKLAALPQEYLRVNQDGEAQIPVRCIQLAQQNYVGHYALCDGEDQMPKVTVIKPCMTENYVTVVYNAYHDVMDCFNIDPRRGFYQIMIESGFHINAINKSGFDSGMAQFTANGIKRVTANNLVERTRRVLLESSRPSCQRISSIVGAFNADAFSVEKRCSMISLPKNPYRSMLFNYLHSMLDQLVLDGMIADLPELGGAYTEKIRRQFMFLSYNRGLTGLKRLLAGYVRSRKSFGVTITEDDLDLSQNLSRAKSILALEPEKRLQLQRSRVRNLSFAEYAVIFQAPYLSDMTEARDYVQRILGDSCGEL